MALISVTTSQFIRTIYPSGIHGSPTMCISLDILKKEDSYIAIFNVGQAKMLKTLEEDKNIKILFKSSRAVNKAPYHGQDPRNTVVVFELADS